MPPLYSNIKNSPPLKAEGNLSYLEFIALVKHMWEESHPDIPFFPTQGKQYAKYPCIVYGLEYRKTVSNESKMKQRLQDLNPIYNNLIVSGQRFENYVSFSVHSQDPYLSEAIIEEFESFMLEYIRVFKRLGLSEILYGRRLSDREDNRKDSDIAVRSVAFLVTTEKITVSEYERIEKITIDASVFLQDYSSLYPETNPLPNINIRDTRSKPDISPDILPAAKVNEPYSQVLTIDNGRPPMRFVRITQNADMPLGMQVYISPAGATAKISGTPLQVGVYQIAIGAVDLNDKHDEKIYEFIVGA